MRAFTQTNLRALRPASTSFPRSFWSSPALRDAEADATMAAYTKRHYELYEGKPEHGTILYKYGGYSFYVTLAAALITKETYIMDAVAISGWIPDFLVCSMFAYAMGPLISNDHHDNYVIYQDRRAKSHKIDTMLLDIELDKILALEAQPAALEQFAAEYKVALEGQAVAETQLAQYAQYEATVAALDNLAKAKADKAKVAGNIDLDLTMDHVLGSLKKDKKIQAATVDEAIALLTGDKSPAEYGATLQKIVKKYQSSDKFKADREAALAALEQ